jgi:HAD superfamily hydrolase (TIGR01459 family)
MNSPVPSIPLLNSIAPLASRYAAWVCDVWGVLHNGVHAFAPAVKACAAFRGEGGLVLLLSNAPRPAAAVQAQLDHFGIAREAYDEIVTSGDLARRILAERPERRVFHLGPARDTGIFDGLDLCIAGERDADIVVCTGLFDDTTETPTDYVPLLGRLAERGLPMICANPDVAVERGARIVYCAGALAAEYERLGCRVLYAGKPHLPIYDLVLERIAARKSAPIARERILAIGDGLNTDIRGAANAGIPSVFVASAIHVPGALNASTLDRLFAESDARPIAAMARLAW